MKSLYDYLKILKNEGILYCLKSILYKILKPLQKLWVKPFIRKLEIAKNSIADLGCLFDFIFNFNILGLNIKPGQKRKEFLKFLKIAKRIKPKIIVEIGTAQGGSLFLFCRIADINAKIISIDLPGGEYGGGYPKWKIPIFKTFVDGNQKIYLIRLDSHKKSTYKKVKRIIGNDSIDVLFIDGDHTYDGVKKDFGMYGKLVKRGIVALHDIVAHPPEKRCEVNLFWKEIKNKYKSVEIIENKNQNWGGIGIIFKNIS
jgi:cephalosporin hydroxylase